MTTDDDKRIPVGVSDSQDQGDDEEVDEKTRLLSREPSPIPSDKEDDEDEVDPRWQQAAPSPLKRFAVIILFIFMLWLGFQLGSTILSAKRKPQIIYASRYSKEHRFRPAASPIITETLKDGRIRLRGALPTEEVKPPPKKAAVGKKKGRKMKRKSQKRK